MKKKKGPIQGGGAPKSISTNSDGDKAAETEFRSKYPNMRLSNKDILQRSVSQGGKQYFDSGDYNMKKKKGPIQGGGAIPQYL
ncbi:hypothetical protein, partial [Salmonella sp. s51228]|uniref:hypothetical protein n=1 Tax=Salmonella sp. s51228 TaxID=3159652 RepID=UPI00397EAE5F